MREGVKNPPEELLCEVQLLLHGEAIAAPPRGQAVILPALLIVARQELAGSNRVAPVGRGSKGENKTASSHQESEMNMETGVPSRDRPSTAQEWSAFLPNELQPDLKLPN